MYISHELGKFGEEVATKYLQQNGYKIIERNFSCRQGEIDIIAKNTEYLIFIEVKTRSSAFFGNASEAVNREKQKHIKSSAKYYLYIKNMENIFVRFDVIEVYVMEGRCRLNHIKQII